MPLYTLPKHLHPDFAEPGRKPVGTVEVDWDNPITRGLLAVFVPQSGGTLYDLVSRTFLTKEGTTLLWDADGWTTGDTDSQFTAPDSSRFDIVGDQSIAIDCFYSTAASNNQTIACNRNSGNVVWDFMVTNGDKLRVNAGGVNVDGSTSLTDRNYILGFSIRDTVESKVFVDGRVDGTGTHTLVDQNAPFRIMARGANSSYWFGKVRALYMWDTVKTEAEQRAIADNFYQILKPAVPISYFTAAAAIAATTAVYTLPKHLHPDFAVKRRKPLGLVEIDWSNPLSRGLTGLWLVGKEPLQNAVTGTFTLVTGSPTFKQGGRVFAASSDVYIHATGAAGDPSCDLINDLTYCCFFNYKDSGTAFQNLIGIRDGATAQGGLRLESNGNVPQFYASPTTTDATTALNTLPEGTPVMVSGSHAANDDVTIYVNGTLEGTGNTNITQQALGIYIGNQANLLQECDSTVQLACQWNRVLNPTEHAALSADPYQILKPAVPISYFTAGAAPPVGFEPQWYRNRSAIIGAGMK